MFFKALKEKLDNRWIKVLMEVLLASIAFVLPFLLMLFISLSNKIYPFGNNTIMMIDMQSQYISYMRYYKSLLNGDSSMIYSLSKVFGGDFISIYAYYLVSPFNLFVAFCPYSERPAFFLCTNIIKIGFSGLNMYLCLRIISKHKSISHYIMSVGYGLISYSIVYFSNFMWLDGVMSFPFLLLGV